MLRQPDGFLWPVPDVGDRIERAAREIGAEVVLFGATYPLGMLGPRLSAAGLPYVAAAHGFEYWLSIAPGTHAAMRYATSKAARVAVMCSEFVARTVRTAVPWRVPVSVLYPGADIEAFRPGLHPGPARASPPGRAATGRVRKQARGSEGSGRADPGNGAHPSEGPGGHPGDRRRRAGREQATIARRRRAVRVGRVRGPGVGAGSSSLLLAGRRVRDAVPDPARRHGGRGWGNVFIEAAACGRPVVVGDSGGAREALVDGETGSWSTAPTTRPSPTPSPGCSPIQIAPGPWGRPAGPGSCGTTPGRRSPAGWCLGSRPRRAEPVPELGPAGASPILLRVGSTLAPWIPVRPVAIVAVPIAARSRASTRNGAASACVS